LGGEHRRDVLDWRFVRHLIAQTVPAAAALLAVPCLAAEWPHWRGPERNGTTSESSGWGEPGGLPAKPLWRAMVGEGSSSPIVHDGKVFCIGWEGGKDVVRCLDAGTGKEIWRQEYPSPPYGRHAVGDQGFYRGATATPEFDPETGLLYTLGCDGELTAWDTGSGGKRIWRRNFYDHFGIGRRPQVTARKGTHRDYGYTCAPLVLGEWLIVETGDRKGGTIKAFLKRSGELCWSSENRDPAGHSGGLAPMMVDGVPCVAVATSWNALVVRVDGLDAGKTVAGFEWKTDFANTIPSVAVEGQDLLISSRYNQMAMARVHVSLAGGAREVWRNEHPTGVCTPVIHGGNIYFANKGIHCVDFGTGKLKWVGGKIGDAGSCYVTGDERLVVWGNSGDLFLVEGAARSPDRCRVLAERRGVFRNMAWPHVVGAGGRIFCKTRAGELACFDRSGVAPAVVAAAGGDTKGEFRPGNFGAWPGADADVLIAWKQGAGVGGCVGKARRVRLEARGKAGFGESGEMLLAEGGFHARGMAGTLLDALKTSNQFSVELVLETANLEQFGPARILSFSKDPYLRNFTVGQERDRLTLRLRTPATGTNGMKPETVLCPIEAGKPVHLVVTYRPGETVTFVNGKEVSRSDKVRGDFSNWESGQELILGDEWSGESRDWAGKVHAFAVFQRVLSAEEVAKRCAAAGGG
jgi:outer membrane protein assembly factor BamB